MSIFKIKNRQTNHFKTMPDQHFPKQQIKSLKSLAQDAIAKLKQISLTEQIQKDQYWQITNRQLGLNKNDIKLKCIKVNLKQLKQKPYKRNRLFVKNNKQKNINTEKSQQHIINLQNRKIPFKSINLYFNKDLKQVKGTRIHSKTISCQQNSQRQTVFDMMITQQNILIKKQKEETVNKYNQRKKSWLKRVEIKNNIDKQKLKNDVPLVKDIEKKHRKNVHYKTASAFPYQFVKKNITFNHSNIFFSQFHSLKNILLLQKNNIFCPLMNKYTKDKEYRFRDTSF